MDPIIFFASTIVTILILIIYLFWHLRVGGTEWQKDFSSVFVIFLYVLTVSLGAIKIFSIPKGFTNPEAPVVEEIFGSMISIFATLLEFMVFSLSLVLLAIMGELNILEFFLKVLLENPAFWILIIGSSVVYFFSSKIYAKNVHPVFSFIFNNALISIIRSIMCLAIWMLIWGGFSNIVTSHEPWGFWVFWGVSLLFCLLPGLFMLVGGINIPQAVENLIIFGNMAATKVGGFLQPKELLTRTAVRQVDAGEKIELLKVDKTQQRKDMKDMKLIQHAEFKEKVKKRRIDNEADRLGITHDDAKPKILERDTKTKLAKRAAKYPDSRITKLHTTSPKEIEDAKQRQQAPRLPPHPPPPSPT